MSALSGNGIASQISMQGTWQGRPAKVFHVLGQRSDWVDTTTYQDIAEYLDPPFTTFRELVGTESFEIVSNNAADAAAGTGTRTVEIVYIDLNYAMVTTTVTMNGLTPVPIGVLGARMILWMEARTGGTSQVSVGRIFLRFTGGGEVQEVISEGGNKSLSCRFMVPDGYEAFVPSWDTHSIRTSHDCRLRATVRSFDRSLAERYVFQDLARIGADQNGEHGLPFIRLPARAKIKGSAIPGSLAGSPSCDISFTVVLIAGD